MDSEDEWFDFEPEPSVQYIIHQRALLHSPLYLYEKRKQNDEEFRFKDSPLTGREHWQNIKNYIWNRETKRFCARDGLEWARLGCYYFSFFFTLGLLFSVIVAVYIMLIDKKTPRRMLNDSALALDHGINPGLGFRPQIHLDRTILRWRSSRRTGNSSVTTMVDNIHEWVQVYGLKDKYYQQMIDCGPLPRHLLINYFRQGLSCIFLGTDMKPGPSPCVKPRNYGYNKGRPCVVIKLNRIFGWVPEPYESKEEVPREIRHLWQPKMKNFILIKCFGQYPTDQDLIHQVDHYSVLSNKAIGGLPIFYYPYLNQPGYRQPYIMVQFTRIESNVLLNIVCRAYARNIRQRASLEDMTGAVHFEIFFE